MPSEMLVKNISNIYSLLYSAMLLLFYILVLLFCKLVLASKIQFLSTVFLCSEFKLENICSCSKFLRENFLR